MKARGYARRLRYSTRIENGLCGLANIDFKTVLDIGAADGRSAKKYLKLFPSAQIHSFEPQLEEYLKLTQLMNKEPRLSSYNIALGCNADVGATSSLTRYADESTSTASLLAPAKNKEVALVTEYVAITTLDKWGESHTLEEPILIKMDVQGFEQDIIQGGYEIFKSTKAVIAEASFAEDYIGQASFTGIHFDLFELSLHYIGNLEQVASPDGTIRFIDACFLRP